METKSKLSAQWWWFDSQSNTIPRKSPWLHSTLAELDDKTEAMLKLIEEDADSFAKRAEMYYKKRPELINIVEDLYRTHRSLAEKYDQVKFDSGNRNLTPWTSCPLPLSKFRNSHLKESEKSFDSYSESKFRTSLLIKESEKGYDSYSESFDYEHDYESGDSVVIDDFEHEHGEYNETQVDEETEELMKLKEEVERLREENKIQKEELVQKDDEKREAIRQLSFSVDFLKQENTNLKTRLANDSFKKQTNNSNSNNNSSPFEFTKLKGDFGEDFLMVLYLYRVEKSGIFVTFFLSSVRST